MVALLTFASFEWCWHHAFRFFLMASSPAGMAQTMLNTVVLVFTLIAGLIVFLRLFTRGLLLHKAGAEDAWISFAMVSAHTSSRLHRLTVVITRSCRLA